MEQSSVQGRRLSPRLLTLMILILSMVACLAGSPRSRRPRLRARPPPAPAAWWGRRSPVATGTSGAALTPDLNAVLEHVSRDLPEGRMAFNPPEEMR